MRQESLDALGAIDVTDALAVVLPDKPRVLHKGVYTLWEKPDGTLRIQYRRDDSETDDFMEIPGAMLRIAKAMSEGKMNPLAAFKAMRASVDLCTFGVT